jgi:L-asparagine oxygenase
VLRTITLAENERIAVRKLLVEIGRDTENLDEKFFLDHAALLACELPYRIREALYEFKLREEYPGLLMVNNPVFAPDVGPTPQSHWRQGQTRTLTLPQLMHGLYASCLGEPFGFETQQDGRLFNDLIPIKGQPPNSSSGTGHVGLHTEDCYQPFMPDYLGLLCLRNDERAVTLMSSLWHVDIPEQIRQLLFREEFPATAPGRPGANAPPKRAILFGDLEHPYLKFGSIDREACTREMLDAFRFISDALERSQRPVTLSQGDCLYLDNFVAVHGRSAYRCEYGSNGRWFCRLVMARDLRRTRIYRGSPDKRVMLKHTY